jgi:plastocyanin
MFIILPPVIVKAQSTVQILPGTSDITSQTNAAVGGSTFRPPSLCIESGANVTWNNTDSNPHSIVIANGGKTIAELPTIAPGEAAKTNFKNNGTYTYYDKYFPFTTGQIKVGQVSGMKC